MIKGMSLILAVVVITALLTHLAPAQSQMPITVGPMPHTVAIKNKVTGETIGTATTWGGRVYMRNATGELTGFMVYADGKWIIHDVHGKVVDGSVR
jgi:hypothetical protein